MFTKMFKNMLSSVSEVLIFSLYTLFFCDLQVPDSSNPASNWDVEICSEAAIQARFRQT